MSTLKFHPAVIGTFGLVVIGGMYHLVYQMPFQVAASDRPSQAEMSVESAVPQSVDEEGGAAFVDESSSTSAVMTLKMLSRTHAASSSVSDDAIEVLSTAFFPVPFYSQFADIRSPQWQKVGCGIASLAMLIDFHSTKQVSVEGLLAEGIASGAYIPSAGWSHAGLIALATDYGLTGRSKSLAHLSGADAFAALERVLQDGPVMVSVHYTFEPTNPIPHLVVVNGVSQGQIYYNDPAEKSGGGTLSIERFKKAWKQRYIEIRPL